MDGFDFETDRRYRLFEKALKGEDVSDMMRQFQEEDSVEYEYGERAVRRGKQFARSPRDAGVWDWMDQEEQWEAMEEAGYDPEDFD